MDNFLIFTLSTSENSSLQWIQSSPGYLCNTSCMGDALKGSRKNTAWHAFSFHCLCHCQGMRENYYLCTCGCHCLATSEGTFKLQACLPCLRLLFPCKSTGWVSKEKKIRKRKPSPANINPVGKNGKCLSILYSNLSKASAAILPIPCPPPVTITILLAILTGIQKCFKMLLF